MTSGRARFRAFSAGSHPGTAPNPIAVIPSSVNDCFGHDRRSALGRKRAVHFWNVSGDLGHVDRFGVSSCLR